MTAPKDTSLSSIFQVVSRQLSQKVQLGIQYLSRKVCPPEFSKHLKNCYDAAENIGCQVLVITGQVDDRDLLHIADILEVADGSLSSYADLMGLLTCAEDVNFNQSYGGGEESSFRVRNMGKAASRFVQSYDSLPKGTQRLLNLALNPQKTTIIGLIENKAEVLLVTQQLALAKAHQRLPL